MTTFLITSDLSLNKVALLLLVLTKILSAQMKIMIFFIYQASNVFSQLNVETELPYYHMNIFYFDTNLPPFYQIWH